MNTSALKVYLSTGSNLGDRFSYLEEARKRLSSILGPLESMSPVYQSSSWGFTGCDFLNQILVYELTIEPLHLLHKLQRIERQMGRVNVEGGYSDRIIDIDILFFGGLTLHLPQLTLPHPRLHERRFILQPLHDIAPLMLHPVMNQNVHTLLKGCKDDNSVSRFICDMTT